MLVTCVFPSKMKGSRFDGAVAGGKALVPCPQDGTPARVQGGWQEARGGPIGTNNGFFVDNIKEELDVNPISPPMNCIYNTT